VLRKKLDQQQVLTYGTTDEEDAGKIVDDASGSVKLRDGLGAGRTTTLVMGCKVDWVEPPSVLLAAWLLVLFHGPLGCKANKGDGLKYLLTHSMQMLTRIRKVNNRKKLVTYDDQGCPVL
jgi:hypothetical protein